MEIDELLKNCINIHRLRKGGDTREFLGLEYLKSHTMRCGNNGSTANFNSLKDLLFCMDEHETNFSHIQSDRKELVKKLIDNEDVVDIVLCTLFQWIGTNVGSCDMKELVKKMSEHRREEVVKDYHNNQQNKPSEVSVDSSHK